MVLEASVESDSVDEWPEKVIDAENNRQMEAASTGFSIMQENIAQDATDRGTMGQDAFPPEQREGRIVYGIGGTSAAYGLAQEEGTEPFTPPIQPLLDWGERKFGSEDIGAAAWQTIREEGIKEKAFMKDSLDVVGEVLNGAEIEDYINEEIDGV